MGGGGYRVRGYGKLWKGGRVMGNVREVLRSYEGAGGVLVDEV